MVFVIILSFLIEIKIWLYISFDRKVNIVASILIPIYSAKQANKLISPR